MVKFQKEKGYFTKFKILKKSLMSIFNGHTLDRDTNASINVKRFAFYKITTTDGISGSNACGDEAIASSAKQEAHWSLANG